MPLGCTVRVQLARIEFLVFKGVRMPNEGPCFLYGIKEGVITIGERPPPFTHRFLKQTKVGGKVSSAISSSSLCSRIEVVDNNFFVSPCLGCA